MFFLLLIFSQERGPPGAGRHTGELASQPQHKSPARGSILFHSTSPIVPGGGDFSGFVRVTRRDLQKSIKIKPPAWWMATSNFKRAHFVRFLILITARAASGEKCGGLCGKARAKREAHYRASLAASEKQRAANAFAHIHHPRLFICMHAAVLSWTRSLRESQEIADEVICLAK